MASLPRPSPRGTWRREGWGPPLHSPSGTLIPPRQRAAWELGWPFLSLFPPSLPPLVLEEGPGNRSRRAVGSSFVDSAICVARPGADGRAPCSPQGHTCTCARVSARGHMAGVQDVIYLPPRPPGTCQGLPGAGGPEVRKGKDWTGLRACLGQSFQLWLLRGHLAREQMGVPSAILLGRPQPDMPVQGSTSHHCAGET